MLSGRNNGLMSGGFLRGRAKETGWLAFASRQLQNGRCTFAMSGVLLAGLLLAGPSGGEQEPSGEDPDTPGHYQAMDYGPVIAESIRQHWPEEALVRKGLAIRVGEEAAMIFDTDLMRFAAGTTGGWLDISGTAYTSFKGEDIPRIEGRQVFGSSEIAGWAKDGSFHGPREAGLGNLPRDWARYHGYYRHGDQVVLSYSVGETAVLELPGALVHEETGSTGLMRTLQVGASGRSMQALILEKRSSWSVARSGEREVILDTGAGALAVLLVDGQEHARLAEGQGRLELHLSPSERSRTVRVMIFEVDAPDDPLFEEFPALLENRPLPDLTSRVQGGPAQWEEEIEVAGERSGESSAYVIDRIAVPFDNPWGSWMRFTGFDFFEGGTRAAVSTWNGDVWIVSGVDDRLENLRWRRYASGLFYPMGLAIVGGQIHVTERSQLTRLHDLNGNGEADFYENVNNDGVVHPMAHSLNLEVDSQGYFYFFKNGNRVPGEVPLHGSLVRVSPDGETREVYATGLRGANTIAIGPGDRIMTADQEGNWVPVERLDVMKKGGFYGFRRHGGDTLPVGEFETPVAWMPRHINNSSGSLTRVGDSRWGPLAGHWILGSYGQGTLLAVLTEEMGGRLQGGVVDLSLDTATGLMRGRMNPGDGQLYKIGMTGWGRAAWDPDAIEDARFLRIRYTGGAANLPAGLKTTPEGITIEFTDPLDPQSGRDVNNYTVERWEYIYSERYGSPEMSLENPEQEGRDPVTVRSVTVGEDHRSVFLEMEDVRSVMQMKIGYDLQFGDGSRDRRSIYFTLNWTTPEEAVGNPAWQQRIIDGYREPELLDEEQEDEPVFTEGEQPDWYGRGENTFQSFCASCHVGGGVAPQMNESEWAAGSPEAFVRIVLHGKQGERGVMAPFFWMENEEIASVVNYVRMRWYGNARQISGDEVEQIRRHTRERSGLWTEEELKELNFN